MKYVAVIKHWVYVLRTYSPIILTVQHDGLINVDVKGVFRGRNVGVTGRDKYTAVFANDVNLNKYEDYIPVANIVRGLFPRSIVDYNRALNEHDGDHATCDYGGYISYLYFHQVIDFLIRDAMNRFGYCLLLDIHGFKKQPENGIFDVVFGTHHNTTVSTSIPVSFTSFLSQSGFKIFFPQDHIVEGERYVGRGTILEHSRELIDAVQMEISSDVRTGDNGQRSKELAQLTRDFLLEAIKTRNCK